MIDWKSRSSAVLAVTSLVAVLAVAGVLGCGRNQGDTESGFRPSGVKSAETFTITQVDSFDANASYPAGPGVAVFVLDRGRSSSFQVYRWESGTNDAFEQPLIYNAPFERSWNQGWNVFSAIDRTYEEGKKYVYEARGVVEGISSGAAPIAEQSEVPAGTVVDLRPGFFDMLAPIDTVSTDSLPTFSWEAVPGAVQYLLEVQRTDGSQFMVVATEPNGVPAFDMRNPDGLQIHYVSPLTPSSFFWTVTALDEDRRVIGEVPMRQIFQVTCIQELIFGLPCMP